MSRAAVIHTNRYLEGSDLHIWLLLGFFILNTF